MIRAVVVGTTGNSGRHLKRLHIGVDKQIGTGFRSAVGTARIQGCLLRKIAVITQASVHFVCRNLMETNILFPCRITLRVLTGGPGSLGFIQ